MTGTEAAALVILFAASVISCGYLLTRVVPRRSAEAAAGEGVPAAWSITDASLVFGLFLAGYVLAPIASLGLGRVLHYRPDSQTMVIVSVLLTYLFNVPTVVVIFLFARRHGRPCLALGFKAAPIDASAAVAGLIFLSFLPFEFVYPQLVNSAWQWVTHQKPAPQEVVRVFSEAGAPLTAVLLMAGVVIAPFIEELVFRAFIQRGIENRLGPAWAVALTSVLFVSVHGSPSTGISLLPLALLLSTLYARSRNIVINMFLHSVFNASNLLIVLLARLISVDLTGMVR